MRILGPGREVGAYRVERWDLATDTWSAGEAAVAGDVEFRAIHMVRALADGTGEVDAGQTRLAREILAREAQERMPRLDDGVERRRGGRGR